MTTEDPIEERPMPLEARAWLFRCPICTEKRAIDEPIPGLFALCSACLGVLRIDGGEGGGVRARVVLPITQEDLAAMPSEVQQGLLEEKTRLMRARAAAAGRPLPEGFAGLREALLSFERLVDRADPKLIERAERELARVEELEREREG